MGGGVSGADGRTSGERSRGYTSAQLPASDQVKVGKSAEVAPTEPPRGKSSELQSGHADTYTEMGQARPKAKDEGKPVSAEQLRRARGPRARKAQLAGARAAAGRESSDIVGVGGQKTAGQSVESALGEPLRSSAFEVQRGTSGPAANLSGSAGLQRPQSPADTGEIVGPELSPDAPKADPPPHSYEIPADPGARKALVQKLKQGDAVDRKLAAIVEKAGSTYAATIDPRNAVNGVSGKLFVTVSEGNGNQPVLTLVPPGYDPSKPAHVQTHYHGSSGTITDEKGNGGVAGRMEEVMGVGKPNDENGNPPPGVDRQRILVLPESKMPGGDSNGMWDNVSSEAQTTDDALDAAGIAKGPNDQYILSAHSGGGLAIRRAMDEDTKHPEGPRRCQANYVELLDCVHFNNSVPHPTEAETIAAWGAAHKDEVKTVSLVHATMPTSAAEMKSIEDAFGADKMRHIEVHGNGSPPKDAGKPRWTSPHGRARGEYLGSTPITDD
jgi:hypothetical protein